MNIEHVTCALSDNDSSTFAWMAQLRWPLHCSLLSYSLLLLFSLLFTFKVY